MKTVDGSAGSVWRIIECRCFYHIDLIPAQNLPSQKTLRFSDSLVLPLAQIPRPVPMVAPPYGVLNYYRTGFNAGSLRTAFGAGALRVTARVGVTGCGLVTDLRSFGMRTGEAFRTWPKTARSLARAAMIPFARDTSPQ